MSSRRVRLTLTRKRYIQAFKELSEKDSTGRYGERGSEQWTEKLTEHFYALDGDVEVDSVRYWIKHHKWITEPYSQQAETSTYGKRKNQRQSPNSNGLSHNGTSKSSSEPGSFESIFLELKKKIKAGTLENQAITSPVAGTSHFQPKVVTPPPPPTPPEDLQFETADGSDIQIVGAFSLSPRTALYKVDVKDENASTTSGVPSDDDMGNCGCIVFPEPDAVPQFDDSFDSSSSSENQGTTPTINTADKADEPYILELVPVDPEHPDIPKSTEILPLQNRYHPYSRIERSQKDQAVVKAIHHCAELARIFASNSFKEERVTCLPHIGDVAFKCWKELYGPDVLQHQTQAIDGLEDSYIVEIDIADGTDAVELTRDAPGHGY